MPISLTLLILLALPILPRVSVSAGESPYSPADAISVEPAMALILEIGQTVTVNITITNITDCAGYMFKLDYNSSILEVVPKSTFPYHNVTLDTDPANPLTPSQMAPFPAGRLDTDRSVLGSIKFSTVWLVGVPTYNGSGVAAQITFNGTMVGISTLIFDQTSTRATDYWGDDILFATFNDGEIEVIPEFPVAIIMPLLLTATLAVAFLAKIVLSRKRRSPTIT